MIRIVHFADLHLGVENYGRLDPETGLSSRVRDFLDRLDELVNFALAEQVDVVAFAGDAFKSRFVDPTYQRDFARRMAKLAHAGIQVVLVAGNHDLPAMLVKATTLDIFRALDVSNVHVVARRGELLRLELPGGRVLQVAAYPYLVRSRLLLDESKRQMTLREQEDYIRDRVAAELQELAAQVDRQHPAIFVGHLMVLGAVVGSEKGLTLGPVPDATPATVARPEYDAVLLGHVHHGQVLRDAQPPMLYSGTLERVDFGDEGVAKGFYLVEIDETQPAPRPVTYRLVPVQARTFLTLEVDTRRKRKDVDVMALAEKVVEKARQQGRLSGAVVRLRLRVREQEARQVDAQALRRELAADAFYVAGVQVEVEQAERVAARGVPVAGLNPLEALERFWVGRGVPEKRRERLLEMAGTLLAETRQQQAARGENAEPGE